MQMRVKAVLVLGVVLLQSPSAWGEERRANRWIKVSEDQVGPRSSPGLVWSPPLKRFVLVAGIVSHAHKEPRPYDVQSLSPEDGKWQNDLPKGAEKRGGLTGAVTDPGFTSPYFLLEDRDGVARPHPYQARLDYQYALAPWDGMVYALICGRTLRYDPVARSWKDMAPSGGPAPAEKSYKQTLCWGALCADPVNREILLLGGGGLERDQGRPGTWVYSPAKNRWRNLEARVQPPARALAPMVFDPVSEKIVLFGGDGLDQLRADTWVYDPKTRTWEERKPALSPSPRFGHALLYLPVSKKIVLVGGKGYTSSTSYMAQLYRPLAMEMWSFDVVKDSWALVSRTEEGPPQIPLHAQVAATSDKDQVLLVIPRMGSKPPSTWVCQVDASVEDREGTLKHGVPPGRVETRTGPYDPLWYAKDVPPADPEATAAILEKLPANRWTALKCPRWPNNRMGGGWSTVAIDPDRDQILHLGGGHSSYFGNDVAHYDIRTGRWSISYRPQFALDFNYDLSGPGQWAFNNGPWGNHNYHAYTYDPTSKRLVFLRGLTQLYNPETRSWSMEEKIATPFPISKYTTYVCPTPEGVVAWTHTSTGSAMGLFRLEKGSRWVKLPVSGDPLPVSVTDGSTIVHDSRRKQLIFTTTPRQKDGEPAGQVWTYDLETGVVKKQNPTGMEGIEVQRFAREAVYLPKQDLVMMGYHLGNQTVTPFYDVAGNRWLTGRVPGSEFYSRNRKDATGASVDLGLVYDAKRDLVWGVMCNLHDTGALNVLRVEGEGLELKPIK